MRYVVKSLSDRIFHLADEPHTRSYCPRLRGALVVVDADYASERIADRRVSVCEPCRTVRREREAAERSMTDDFMITDIAGPARRRPAEEPGLFGLGDFAAGAPAVADVPAVDAEAAETLPVVDAAAVVAVGLPVVDIPVVDASEAAETPAEISTLSGARQADGVEHGESPYHGGRQCVAGQRIRWAYVQADPAGRLTHYLTCCEYGPRIQHAGTTAMPKRGIAGAGTVTVGKLADRNGFAVAGSWELVDDRTKRAALERHDGPRDALPVVDAAAVVAAGVPVVDAPAGACGPEVPAAADVTAEVDHQAASEPAAEATDRPESAEAHEHTAAWIEMRADLACGGTTYHAVCDCGQEVGAWTGRQPGISSGTLRKPLTIMDASTATGDSFASRSGFDRMSGWETVSDSVRRARIEVRDEEDRPDFTPACGPLCGHSVICRPRPAAPAVAEPAAVDVEPKPQDVTTEADPAEVWEEEGGAAPVATEADHQADDSATGEEPREIGESRRPGWAPAANGERWDIALVRETLAARGLPGGEDGDGWRVGPDMWNVMITRVQGSDYFRPRGTRARQEWDAALLAYAEAVEGAQGLELVRRNAHCVVVRVDVPVALMFTARARRVGGLDEFTTAVEFEGWGIGGTVELRTAGAGASVFVVRDHAGRTVPYPSRASRRAATASLAHWYGLPSPAQYVKEGREHPAARAARGGTEDAEQHDDQEAAHGPNLEQGTADEAPRTTAGDELTAAAGVAETPAAVDVTGLDHRVRAALVEAASHPSGMAPERTNAWVLGELVDAGLLTAHRGIGSVTEEGRRAAATLSPERLVIVPCGAKKQTAEEVCEAGEMYVGSYHQACRRAAEALAEDGCRVLILSAKYGLLRLTDYIARYDLRAGDPGAITGEALREQAHKLYATGAQVTILGGAEYVRLAREVWPDAEAPLSGCRGIGEQLARLAGIRKGVPAPPVVETVVDAERVAAVEPAVVDVESGPADTMTEADPEDHHARVALTKAAANPSGPVFEEVTLFDVAPAPAAPGAARKKAKRPRTVHASVPFVPATTDPARMVTGADIIVFNTSGGRDSQAMESSVVRIVRAAGMLHKVVAVHADLGRIEWAGTRELAEEQARRVGITRFEVVQAKGGDLLDKTRARYHRLKIKAEKEARERGDDPATAKVAPAWPSSSSRWCTSGEKRGPIWTLFTRLADEFHAQQRARGEQERPVRILNCLGQRAAESTSRARLAPVEIDRPASNGQRHVTTWRPIHGWSDRQVWAEIAASGLPYHEAYDWGMTRLSCSFCVLGCKADSILAARLLPDLAADYVATEDYVGATWKHGLSMREIVARAAELDAIGTLVKPPRGTAMAGYLGRRATRAYLLGLDLAA